MITSWKCLLNLKPQVYFDKQLTNNVVSHFITNWHVSTKQSFYLQRVYFASSKAVINAKYRNNLTSLKTLAKSIKPIEGW